MLVVGSGGVLASEAGRQSHRNVPIKTSICSVELRHGPVNSG